MSTQGRLNRTTGLRRPAPHIALALFLLVAAGAACDRTKSEWADASKADSADSYRQFLRDHPNSDYTDTARTRLDLLRKRDASRAVVAAAWAEVIPTRPKDGPALALTLDDAVRASHEGSVGKPLSPADEQFLIDVLVAAVSKTAANELTAFASIRPNSKEPPIIAERPQSGLAAAAGPAQQGDTVRFSGRIISGPSGSRTGSLILGTGRHAVSVRSILRANIVASTTIIGVDETHVAFATELPRDAITFTAFTREFRFPEGEGTVLRFKGRAAGVWAGWVFEGDPAAPLVVVLTRESGLVYVCGRGSVRNPSGRTITFPPSREPAPAVATASAEPK